MSLVLSDEFLNGVGLTEAEVKRELALLLYQQERVSVGRAAEIACLGVADFMDLLRDRDVALHYGEEELRQDLAAAEEHRSE